MSTVLSEDMKVARPKTDAKIGLVGRHKVEKKHKKTKKKKQKDHKNKAIKEKENLLSKNKQTQGHSSITKMPQAPAQMTKTADTPAAGESKKKKRKRQHKTVKQSDSSAKKVKLNDMDKPNSVSDEKSQKMDSNATSGASPEVTKKRKQGTCMKHKKKDKVDLRSKHKKFKKKHKKKTDKDKQVLKPEKVHFPRQKEEISANWKKLAQIIGASEPKKKKESEVKKTLKPEVEKDEPEKPDIWFDNVDEILLKKPSSKEKTKDPLVKTDSYEGLTNAVSMDCEMVGVGETGVDSILARISIVNLFGKCIFDKYVKPSEEVTDYRTFVSGIRPEDLKKGEEFSVVQKKASEILKGRILVGHALTNDLKVLFLDHPRKKIRDTSRYRPFRKLFNGRTPSLKKLTDQVLGVQVQKGEHNSVQDAQAAMRLYTMHKKQWEKEMKDARRKVAKKTKKKEEEEEESGSE